MSQYTIGEFAKYAGVTQRTLRYYDKIGLQRHIEKVVKKSGKLYITENTGIFSAK